MLAALQNLVAPRYAPPLNARRLQYKEFLGPVIEQLPLLRADGREALTFNGILRKRLDALQEDLLARAYCSRFD